VYKRSVIHQT